MEKIKTKIKNSSEIGLFHDSRRDINTLAKVCNELIIKVNELIEEVNYLKTNH